MKDDDALQALYRAARSEEDPSPEDRRAVRTALAGAFAGTLAVHGAAAAPAVAKVITVGKVATWVSFGIVVGVASSSAVMVAKSRVHRDSTLASANTPATVPSARGLGRPPARTEPVSSAAARPSQAERPGTPIRPSTERNSASLLDETRGLTEIQQALGRRDAERALELLNEQESRFRDGALGEERAAVRVLALCGAGRGAEAQAARTGFVSTYPNSPLVKRVLRTCPP